MNRNNTIAKFKSVREVHESLLVQGQILLDGLDLHTTDNPQKCTESEFGQWLLSEDAYISKFDWYLDIMYLHRESLKSYSVLFNDSAQTYKPITRSELLEKQLDFDVKTKDFFARLDEIEAFLTDMDDEDFNALINTEITKSLVKNTEDTDDSPKEELISVESIEAFVQEIKAEIESEKQESNVSKFVPIDISSSIVNVDQLEQELIEKEFNHLDDHLKDTQLSVEQMKQYYILKQFEIEHEQHQNNIFEADSIQTRTLLQKERDSLDQQLKDKIQILHDLESSEEKTDSIASEISFNGIALETMEKKKTCMFEDVNKLKMSQHLKELDLEHLLKQLDSAKVDLEKIIEKQQLKEQELEELNLEFDVKKIKHQEQIKLQDTFQSRIDLQQEINILDENVQLNAEKLASIDSELQEYQQQNKLFLVEKQQELIQLDQQIETKQQELQELAESQ